MMILDKCRVVCCGAMLVALFCVSSLPVRAQQTPPPAVTKAAKDNAAIMDDWADLGTLRVLTPLKLTPAQIDKLIAIIGETEVEHNQKMVNVFTASLQKIAPDIRAAKKKALAGEDVPAELADRLKKGMEAHLDAVGQKKQEELTMSTLKTFSPKVKALFNAAQVKTAAKLAQEEQEKIAKGSNGTETQWFNYYVQRVFMGYPRIVPLLKELKGAPTSTTEGTSGAGGKE